MAVVFVYGTLTDRSQVSALLDTYTFGPEAVCRGLTRVDGAYPTLVPGETAAGRLLATPELSRLDSYEGLDRGLYCRVTVPLSGQASWTTDDTTDPTFETDTAELYVGNPTALGVTDQANWPEAESFTERVGQYLARSDVKVEIRNDRRTTSDDC